MNKSKKTQKKCFNFYRFKRLLNERINVNNYIINNNA